MAIVNEGTRARFAGDGYLILRGLLDPERDLAPLRLEYESLLDVVADRLHSAGAVVSAAGASAVPVASAWWSGFITQGMKSRYCI